jgi:excisionase family DNA binding protein
MAKMVSIAGAANYYDVSRQTVRRWIARGKITALSRQTPAAPSRS